MKVALIFFALGIVQGMIILDWLRSKQDLQAVISKTGKK